MDHLLDLLISRGLKNWVAAHPLKGDKKNNLWNNMALGEPSSAVVNTRYQFQPFLFSPRSARLLLRETPNPALFVFRDWSFHLAISMFNLA
ncbi:MAG TPA: hypothetical protein VLS48_00040 [Anaerolineales bacterium]|nr:hypothetical protein [Anaerolineales bacterium]